MRKVIDEQIKIGEVNIKDIKFDLRSRDEIPKTLIGLQKIFCTPDLREKIFSLLEEHINPDIDKGTGRPGMNLWKILVLGSIRINSSFDYDKLQEMANQHLALRQMLGHSFMDMSYYYPLQTLKDNVSLLTPELLDKINEVVVKFGLKQTQKKKS